MNQINSEKNVIQYTSDLMKGPFKPGLSSRG